MTKNQDNSERFYRKTATSKNIKKQCGRPEIPVKLQNFIEKIKRRCFGLEVIVGFYHF